MEKLTQRHNRLEPVSLDKCDNERCASTQFLKYKRNQLGDQQEHLKKFCTVLPVFGFNRANCDPNLIKPICYPFLLTNATLNLWSSRKRTNSSRSSLVIFNYWIYWTFLAEQQALIHSRRHLKLQKQKKFSLTNGLITLTKCKIQNLLRMTPSTVIFVAVVLLKQNTTTLLFHWEVEIPQKGLLSNWDHQSHNLQELRTINSSNNHGSTEKRIHWKIFLRSYNNEDVLLWTLKAMQKMIAFYHEKNTDMLKLGFTLQNLANICPHKPTDTKFYPFKEPEKDLLEKNEKMLLLVLLLYLHAKKLLMRPLFESLQTYANQLLGLMLANYIHIHCFDQGQPDFIRIEISIQR